MSLHRLVIAFTAGTLLSLVGPVRAAAPDALAPYPTRPIRMIVASSPGTASDYFARVISEQLAAAYRQQIVVDNRAGAGGLIGNAIISKANPDGHTLAMVGVTRIISELIRPDAPYDALNDIAG
ncbi:MAG TPA: tripartite tricarboxylate transporter substrate-binding protein, partial [Burkholderiales bacterium]